MAACEDELVEGKPINIGSYYRPVFGVATMDARNAAASALAAYLRGLVFFQSGLDRAADQRFSLESVFHTFPGPEQDMDYPCASVIDATSVRLNHSLTPTILTETYDQFCENTVLWKVDEMAATFQVDFWANNDSVNEAIFAVLPGAFAPSEIRTGIVLQCSSRYYGRTVRCTLDEYKRVDTGPRAFDRERRIMCRIDAEIDVVQLREVRELQPHVVTEVTDSDPVDCC